MAATATRLLVLGVVRSMGPVHGYDLRRTLLSWGADQWANVAPGSIYNALRALTREGLLEVLGTDRLGARPERTVYRLTQQGDQELDRLLCANLRKSPTPNHPLLAGLAFLPFLPPQDVIKALRQRADDVRAQAASIRAKIDAMARGEVEPTPPCGVIPPHLVEGLRLIATLLESEAAWALDFVARLERGETDEIWGSGHPADT